MLNCMKQEYESFHDRLKSVMNPSNPSGLNCDHSGSICNAEPNVDAVSA